MRRIPERIRRLDPRNAGLLGLGVVTLVAVVAAVASGDDPPRSAGAPGPAVSSARAASTTPAASSARPVSSAPAARPASARPARRAARSHVRLALYRRPRGAPVLRVVPSHRGRVTVRWRSGRHHGSRTLRAAARRPGVIALRGVPSHDAHAVRVVARLVPAGRGRAPARATRVYRAPRR